MRCKNILAIVLAVIFLAVFGTMARAVQDRFVLQIPNGLMFPEIREHDTGCRSQSG